MDVVASGTYVRSDRRRGWAVTVAIVLLPLLGFYTDRQFGDAFTRFVGPALYAVYFLGLVAYGAIVSNRLPWLLRSAAAGVLGLGACVSTSIGLIGMLVVLPGSWLSHWRSH